MPPLDPDDRLLSRLRATASPGGAGPVEAGVPADAGADDAAFDDVLLARIGRALHGMEHDDALDDDPVSPPVGLWERIDAAVGAPGGGVIEAPDGATVIDLAGRRGPGATGGGRPAGGATPGGGRLRAGRWLAAAAAVAVVAGAGVFAAVRDDGPDVVAEVALQPLEGEGSGSARLVELPDGRRRLVVDETLPSVPAESYVEVWLIDPASDLKRMVSLGPVDGRRTLDIPSGIDPATYSIVDVSIEPADGDPTHSGRSVLRGTIPV